MHIVQKLSILFIKTLKNNHIYITLGIILIRKTAFHRYHTSVYFFPEPLGCGFRELRTKALQGHKKGPIEVVTVENIVGNEFPTLRYGRRRENERAVPVTVGVVVNLPLASLRLINQIWFFKKPKLDGSSGGAVQPQRRELEEGPQVRHLSSEEQDCEDHFKDHTRRDETGRYIVALPFNGRKAELGESRSRALNRYLALERRFSRDTELKREYTAIIKEYLELGHLSEVNASHGMGNFYLPHHVVVKPASTTTKVRVVFDASAKSSSGLSLNDVLMTGPTIQDDLFKLLIRFRTYAYVLTGDIEKMYRQFYVQPNDRRYQRILWRDDDGYIKTYELNTVTFGISSAAYLAVRCLQQLAEDERLSAPIAANVLKRDLYVDDLLTGANTFNDALRLRDEIIDLLKRGGLNIRQWASNEPQLLTGLPKEQIHPKFFGDSSIKTLGISWDARNDDIVYRVDVNFDTQVTKRTILSTISRIFDPLGLLAPVIITAKILIQKLWRLELNWNESLPNDMHTEWTTFMQDFRTLDKVSFPRNVSQRAVVRTELHGFCDASERAYGACIYIRTIDETGNIRIQLLCPKSRVAPLKVISLARLELCGAVLLANLYQNIQQSYPCQFHRNVFWTDSTIVLNWINKEPCTLKTFVANRVADIQDRTSVNAWRHIKSSDNPADLISRRQSPSHFLTHTIWYHGPTWLIKSESDWPPSQFTITSEVPESRPLACFLTVVIRSEEILHRYSSIKRLRRIIAYCLRFKQRDKVKGPLTIEELRHANERIIKLTQASVFSKEINQLKTGKDLQPGSKLISLRPFLDDKGILRVGGRLQNSSLPYEQKHPILLPRNNHITELIIRNAHIQKHHTGINTTLCIVRQQYWLIDGKSSVRKIVRRCLRCFRIDPPTVKYTMDYCGPFFIKQRKYRNRARVKVYVAVFVCFATKAVHLEVVGDMTTETFIAALKRFVARRGICRNIYSDNGTNFVGADNELTQLHRELQTDAKVQRWLADKEIAWHFIPALSPNFGGLWEAAVRSFKHHIKRVVGEQLFTLEEFNTLVVEIEAILNSRPLTPLSSDPNDPSALTPAHFLIGNTLTSLPEIDFSETPANRLSKWQHIQKVKQDFWTRWYKEYLHQLNVRQKWSSGSHEIKEGSLVILKDDHLPPLQWHLGRVDKVHPGPDNVIRAVTVRTNQGIYQRNVKQLAPLLVNDATQTPQTFAFRCMRDIDSY
ncbi:uncharacterized protein LOC143186476 [Calliopsis andreniformis]|uniref:uncharacterized protein LOC143186476 n=1 Tax=Calliopsis andreniformis TaxID=337506 RepID=UPI003FCEA539